MTRKFIVDEIEVSSNIAEELSSEEVTKYVNYVKEKNPGKKILSICLNFDEERENVDLSYQVKSVGFERIRRITGYLTGSLDRWNDAKKEEEHDRTKHFFR